MHYFVEESGARDAGGDGFAMPPRVPWKRLIWVMRAVAKVERVLHRLAPAALDVRESGRLRAAGGPVGDRAMEPASAADGKLITAELAVRAPAFGRGGSGRAGSDRADAARFRAAMVPDGIAAGVAHGRSHAPILNTLEFNSAVGRVVKGGGLDWAI